MSSVVMKIEPDRRLQIPAEWDDEFAPEHRYGSVRAVRRRLSGMADQRD